MSNSNSFAFGENNLIRMLFDADRNLVEPHLQPVVLAHRAILEKVGRPIETVIFPVSGVASIIAAGRGGRQIEAGLFGRDGMSGTTVVMDSREAPNLVLMQIPGHGLQIDAGLLRRLLEESPSLRHHLLHFVQALIGQAGQTALSNAHAHLDERLARLLLMCHDRIDGDEINLTHDFLSIMLGVRRAGVTVSTHVLEGRGLIRATRGSIRILDRPSLENAANGSYGASEAEYARLIGYEARAEQSVCLRRSA